MHVTIETERLLLKPTAPEDANFLLKLLNTPKWLNYIGDRQVNSLQGAENYIREKMLPQMLRLGFGNCTIYRKIDQIKIGICGLYDRDKIEGIDLGFALLPEFEGKGYALEASKALIAFGFNTLHLQMIVAITVPKNEASKRLLMKLHFKKTKEIFLKNEELFLFELQKEDYHRHHWPLPIISP